MSPRKRGKNGDHARGTTRNLPRVASIGTSRHNNAGSSQQHARSVSPKGAPVKIEITSSGTMSTEDEFITGDDSPEDIVETSESEDQITEDTFSTGDDSSEDDMSTSGSEDKIVRTKKRPMINLPLGRYIVCGIPGDFYTDEFSTACVWGNTVTLYRNHVIRLRRLINNKKPSIPYYVCQLNETFADPEKRMYFRTGFSKAHLLQHMHERSIELPITSGDGTVCVSAQLIKGVDNRATITSG